MLGDLADMDARISKMENILDERDAQIESLEKELQDQRADNLKVFRAIQVEVNDIKDEVYVVKGGFNVLRRKVR